MVPAHACAGRGGELERAERIGVDFALLSPVKPVTDHSSNEPLGWPEFRRLASEVSLPVYGAGGLCESDLKAALREGAHGIAARSAFWEDSLVNNC